MNTNLKSSLVLILTMTMGQMYADSVLLPYFDTKAALNGNYIENFSNFVQPSGDFTLQLKAKANQEVKLGYGSIAYTPSTDCQLRLVQKDGIVYVFEDNLFKQSITPDYNVTGDNIIANGSLETTETLLTTGKWQATDWYALGESKQSTWGTGGNSVTVRENESYRSDGTKSVILHYNNRYFGQKLAQGAIESNATYKLTCDYWTSSGNNNGGADYRILLGTEQTGSDILDQYAYTTIKGDYSKHSYESILQVGEVAADKDVYFSFYRNSWNCDWLDNVKLVKLTAYQVGLSGTKEAEFTIGAYAPEYMVLPADTYINMTSKIVNPNFDDAAMSNKAPKGWTYSGEVSQSKISTEAKGDGIIAANQNHWQLWYGSSKNGCKAYQTISNLPNGLYEVSATIVTDKIIGSVNLYANDGTTAIVAKDNKTYTVRCIVTDGKLELGLKVDLTHGSTTIDFDNFSLVYIPTNVALDENSDNTIADGYAAQVLLNRTIAADKWNTLVVPFNLSNEQVKAAFGSDAQVAKFTNSTEQTIEFNTTEEGIKANEPVLVKTTVGNTTYTFDNVTLVNDEPISTGVDYSFAGTYNKEYALQDGEYILSSNYFWKNDAEKNYKVKAFRAYLKANNAEAAAKGLNLMIDGQTTGLKLNTTTGEVETATYNLAGQRVAKGYKGIIIKNGKKYINK